MTSQDHRFDLYFEQAPVGLAIVRDDMRLDAVNRELRRILGYGREGLSGTLPATLPEIIHPDDFAPEGWAALRAPLELRLIGRDGGVVWASLDVSRLEDRAIVRIEDIGARKRSEAEREQTLARMNAAQRIAGVGNWSVNLRTGQVYWSDEVFRIFGRDPALGPPDESVDYGGSSVYFAPEDWKKILAAVRRLEQDGVAYALDVEIHCPNGERRWATLRGDRAVDPARGDAEIFGTVQDIGERKRIERSLKQGRDLLKLFIEHAPAALAMFDTAMRYIVASRRLMEMYQLEGGIIGRSHYEIIPDQPERLRQAHDRCLDGEVVRGENERFARANGTVQHTRWELRPWRDAAGAVGGVILFVDDLTESRRAEARLQQSEARLRTILDGVDACIFLKDPQGRYLFANQAVRRLWNAELGQVVGFTDEKFFDAETVARVRANDRRVLEDGETIRLLEHVRVVEADETVAFLSFKLPLRDPDGAIYALCGIATDITERVRAEQRLAESERRYRSLFENMNIGFLLYEVVQDHAGAPVDLVLLAANRGFEQAIGLSAAPMIGKRLTALLPGVENDAVDWIGVYGQVALTGESVQFSAYSDVLAMHLAVAAYQPAPRQCAVTFQDITQRVQAEEEVRRLNADLERRVAERTAEVQAKERFLRTITDAAPGVLGYWDADLRNRFANRRYLEWFGITREWVEGRSMADVLGPVLYAAVAPQVRAVMRGEPQRFERPLTRPDGTDGCVLTQYVPDIVDGVVRGFVVEVSDITDFKQAQAGLSEQAKEYADLYNNAPCGYHSLDRDGVIVRINDTELAWLGLTREEVVGKRRMSELLSEESDEIFRRSFPIIMDAGRIDEIEIELRAADGRLMPVLLSATVERNPDGGFLATRSVVLDYSRLRKEQETFRQVMQAAPMAVRVARLCDNKLLFVNHAFAKLVGRTEEAALRWDIRSGYRDPRVFDEICARLLRGEVVTNQLVEFYRPDLPERPSVWALASFMAIPYEGQKASLAWLYDVTAMHDAKLAAERAMAARSRFLANMSHEIRTPMNAILGFTRLLENENPTPAQADRLGKIDMAARHLLVLIDDILDLSRIEAGGLKLEERDFDLGQLFADVGSLIGPGARAKGLRLNIDMDHMPERVSGDVTRLRQALLNYANNALKFTEKGFITLRVSLIDEGEGVMLARFEVEDSGIGIAPDVLPRLFTMFEQADASITRRYGGAGLGLAIARRLAEAMGGQAGASSAPGGSTFWFTARLKRSTGARDTTVRPSSRDFLPQFGGRATRILLVEDNEINKEVAVELLRAVGLEVLTARDGRDALEKVRAGPVDLVLMDVQMPVMDGMEATREIRKLAGWERKPIVALTAAVFDENRRACLDAGMNDFVSKPVDPAQLYATLARWLPQASAPLSAASPAAIAGGLPAIQGLAIQGLDVAEGVRRMNGAVAAYKRLLRRFADLHGSDIGQIRSCLERDDAEGAALVAHTLKGAAGNIGARTLWTSTGQLETAIRRGEGAGVMPCLAGVEAELAALLEALACVGEDAEPDRPEEVVLDAESLQRTLDQLEAALADGDVRARQIIELSEAALRVALGGQFEEVRRDACDYLFPQALETFRRARKP